MIAGGFVLATGVAIGTLSSREHRDNQSKPSQARDFRVVEQTIEVSSEMAKRLQLETSELKPSSVVVTLHLTGKTSFDGDHVAHVKVQFPGKIMTTGPAVGTAVTGPADAPDRKGTFLGTIESIDLGNAKNTYQKAVVQLDLDQEMARRVKELVDAGVLADRFLKEAEASRRMDEANQEFARHSLFVFGLNERDLEKIPGQERWGRMAYDLTSPVSGIIAEKNVTLGEYTDSTVNLFTIADTRHMWVWGDVYEKDWGKVKVGQKVTVSIAAFPERTYETTIDLIAPALDPITRGIRVRGKIDNQDGKILKDMYSDLKVDIGEDRDALVGPRESVVRGLQTGEAYAFVRKPSPSGSEGQLYERRAVHFEDLEGHRVRFLEGVKPGESLLTVGAGTLYDEMRRKQ